ncbi:MAG: hypothetical protein PW789_05210 [Edaphobacter sp.]|uniref:hypothetical protein n=1 Tax=Edaphobacter sp. TaxID=1934404 RepID=UPI0023937813|nr:hypothetical protein [Edaphobacter sp.]MDE1175988.1 hypothetical protein [Edaphobacter sp.]
MMRFLLVLLVGWTAIGVVGITVSFVNQERTKALKNLGWMIGIWVVYLGALLGTSLHQPQRRLAPGTPQCFGNMCFSVAGTEELPGYLMHQGRLLRVKIIIQNRGTTPKNESGIQAYLVDQQGQRWTEVPGLTGNRLDARVQPGATVISEPVFKLPADVQPQGLIFGHGRFYSGILTIGDSESLLHRPTIALLHR